MWYWRVTSVGSILKRSEHCMMAHPELGWTDTVVDRQSSLLLWVSLDSFSNLWIPPMLAFQ